MQVVIYGCYSCHDDVILDWARFSFWHMRHAKVSFKELRIANICGQLTTEVCVVDAGSPIRYDDPFTDNESPPEPSSRLSLNKSLAQVGLVAPYVELLRDPNSNSP